MDSISNDTDISKPTQPPLPATDKSGTDGAASAPAPEATTNLTDLSGLTAKVAATPDVDPETVARGLALANDPNWPGDDVIGSLAEKLVDHEDFSS